MSSTPVKPTIHKPTSMDHECLFENDTPIKGHKIKYLRNASTGRTPNDDLIEQLAGHYFARVTVPDQRQQQHTKPPSTSNNHHHQNSQRHHSSLSVYTRDERQSGPNKNDDEESGVESDELNKSIEIRSIGVSNLPTKSKATTNAASEAKKADRFRSIYSLESPPLPSTAAASRLG